MTRIERAIYDALEEGKAVYTLKEIAALYAVARGSSHRIYSRIKWETLNARIKESRGQAGLDYVRREALRQQ